VHGPGPIPFTSSPGGAAAARLGWKGEVGGGSDVDKLQLPGERARLAMLSRKVREEGQRIIPTLRNPPGSMNPARRKLSHTGQLRIVASTKGSRIVASPRAKESGLFPHVWRRRRTRPGGSRVDLSRGRSVEECGFAAGLQDSGCGNVGAEERGRGVGSSTILPMRKGEGAVPCGHPSPSPRGKVESWDMTQIIHSAAFGTGWKVRRWHGQRRGFP
jgi:hypothetical protein